MCCPHLGLGLNIQSCPYQVVHVDDSIDPVRDLETINSELCAKDMELCEGSLENALMALRKAQGCARANEPKVDNASVSSPVWRLDGAAPYLPCVDKRCLFVSSVRPFVRSFELPLKLNPESLTGEPYCTCEGRGVTSGRAR